jgi:hypothetical protein
MALGVLALTLIAGCVSGGAREPRESVRALISGDALLLVGFDADGDLATTDAEIAAGLAREFARADINGDGTLAPIEFQNWANAALGGSQLGPYRLDFDRNVDNSITRAEFDAEITARADIYDADGDGRLVRQEFVRSVGQTRPAPRPAR